MPPLGSICFLLSAVQAKLSQASLDNQEPLSGLEAARKLAWEQKRGEHVSFSGWLTAEFGRTVSFSFFFSKIYLLWI